MRRAAWILMALCPLIGQEKYYPTAKDAVNCPRELAVNEDVPGTRVGGTIHRADGRSAAALAYSPKTEEGGLPGFPVDGKPHIFPLEARKQVIGFTVVDQEGKKRRIEECKGKVIVVGFWATTCQASGAELLGMADLQPKGQQFGFEIWPVNYDAGNRWACIRACVQMNKKALATTKMFVPGLGNEGPSVFADKIPALPATFIIDREGRLAVQYAGYEPGALVKALLAILKETPQSPTSPAPASPAATQRPN